MDILNIIFMMSMVSALQAGVKAGVCSVLAYVRL